eukprot:CAMPEP_0113950222 /NCGR_PEP_ID=MMETSP1339-20121228/79887_1 /TAXON_ID=94617 /ORGANISM="Fibrocapsa japonica" /LENGTH=134 /DNA_ID=CAMNT_0000958003 /DNA_START=241 /DNA_END=642 /DNA_ORIENTATION=+ /assembly_acc=CAM_ASM_000762
MKIHSLDLFLGGDPHGVEHGEALQAHQHPQAEEGQLHHRVVHQDQRVQVLHVLQELHLAYVAHAVVGEVEQAHLGAAAQARQQAHPVVVQDQVLQLRQLVQVVQVLHLVVCQVEGGDGQPVQAFDVRDEVVRKR